MDLVKKAFKYRYGLCVICMIAVLTYVVDGLGDQQDATQNLVEGDLQEQVDDAYDSCLSRVDLRTTLYGLLDAVVDSSIPIGVALNLTSVAGYNDLDPATQAYLANLDDVFDAGNDMPNSIETIRDDYKDNFPIPDCEAERREDQKELEEDLNGG